MFVSKKYIDLLEKQIADLQAEKVELKVENARLQRLLIPGMRVVERTENQFEAARKESKPVVVPAARLDVNEPFKGKLERVPVVKGWIQARDQAERLTEETERKEA